MNLRFPVVAVVVVLAATAPVAGQVAPAVAPPGSSQSPSPTIQTDDGAARGARLAAAFPEVQRIFEEYAERAHIPGFAFGILVDGDLVQARGVGVRDVATRDPVNADTVFRIASMTKSFTAMAILSLRDEGRLSLDDPAANHVPELRTLVYPTRDAAPVTIRQLLSHAEGFPEDNPWGDRQLAVCEDEFSAMMRGGIPFSTPPGTAFEYSNYGFAILGRIVSRVSRMPYRDYVEARILRPLGMNATTFEPASVPAGRLAKGYRWQGDAWIEEPMLADGAFGAMGGLLTSITDLARYVSFFMSTWPPSDGPERGPVRRASAREMQTIAREEAPVATRDSVSSPLRVTGGGYGYGLRITQQCGRWDVSHGGGLPGFGSTMRWLPDLGVGLIVVGNRTYAGWSRTVDRAIEVLVRTGALPARKPTPAPSLLAARQGVSDLLGRWDDALADRLAADNLFLDESRAERRRRFEDLRARHGTCRPDGDIDAETALRGRWRMTCDRGWVDLSVTLAPTMPPRVQHLAVRSALPLGNQLAATMARVAGAVGGADPAAGTVSSMFADDAAAAGQVEIAAAKPWGRCEMGQVLEGDGQSRATVRLACENGQLDAVASADVKTGRLTRLTLMPAPGECLP
jgi:CubicO group peptidase (beta-lactamase class C family)